MAERKKRIYEYEGERLVVAYDLARCIHAAECVASLPAVFDPERRPWIEPDRAEAAEVRSAVRSCPTGALQWSSRDGGGEEQAPGRNEIRVVADGPLYVTGELTLQTGEESETETRVALCRCGASSNKPFCDNAHRDVGFADPGRLGERKTGEMEVDGGALRIAPAEDGPLILTGDLTLRGSDGEAHVGQRCALCRCGASANKPYCDGSHKRIGFSAD